MNNRWTYWACFHLLRETLDDGGIKQHLDYNVPNAPIMEYPVSGGRLNLVDPALRIFLSLCGLPSVISPQTQLYDVLAGVDQWFAREFIAKGIEGYDCAGFEALYALKDVGKGWAEIDRLTNLLCGSSLTRLADYSKGWIWLSDSDPAPGSTGLVTAQIYTAAYARQEQNMDDIQRVRIGAVGSNYEHLLLAITQKIDEINDQATEFGLRSDCPEHFSIQKRSKDICSVYLKTSVVDGRHKAEINYDRLYWHQHDHALLHAMLKVLPKQQRYKIQAGIFSSELGL
ncbi:hypothetical protein [Pseudomonas serbica]|jgi:hypothetical protein|uniref:hypothetical protein n=1 Tax=Pseudomonas serbica TaxID=2965074 RepID=UPI00237BA073|nr:hypothetical protein [Pseudomonas serbica]